MTEEKKTHTFDEIQGSFFDKCQLSQKELCNYEMECPHCDYRHFGGGGCECNGGGDSQGECLNHYIYEVATGARDINKPLWNPPKAELPEWFKVDAKLWRKSYNDWYTILSFYDTGEVTEDGAPLFNIKMVASDGREDEATLNDFAFIPEAPFSESFQQLLGKRAWHKVLGLVVHDIDYDYEDNTVFFSYTDKDGSPTSAWEEFHEENFEAVKPPSWFKVGQWIGATKDCHAIGEIVAVDGTVIEVDWIVNGDPIGEQFDVTCATQVLAFVPIKFRPYTYEEAVQLIGKKIVATSLGCDTRWTMIVTNVSICVESGHPRLRINGYEQEYLLECEATIDGQPFGVPVCNP